MKHPIKISRKLFTQFVGMYEAFFWRGRPTRKCKIPWFQCSKEAKFGVEIPSKYQNVKSGLSNSEPFSTDNTRWILLKIYRKLKIYTNHSLHKSTYHLTRTQNYSGNLHCITLINIKMHRLLFLYMYIHMYTIYTIYTHWLPVALLMEFNVSYQKFISWPWIPLPV